MRREHFYRNKKALKRSAAGAVLALFLALQITGCSQTADQNKADRKTEQAQVKKRSISWTLHSCWVAVGICPTI